MTTTRIAGTPASPARTTAWGESPSARVREASSKGQSAAEPAWPCADGMVQRLCTWHLTEVKIESALTRECERPAEMTGPTTVHSGE